MVTGPFPAEPWRRKGIVVLKDDEIERCRYEKDGSELLLNEEIHILEFPVQDDSRVVQDLVESGLVNPGAVLVQSPFDKDEYQEVAQASPLFGLAKHMYFSMFCMYLGAREVNVTEIDGRELSSIKSSGLKGGISQYGGEGSVESQQTEFLRTQVTLHDTFTAGQADLNAAEDLLRRKGLLGDMNMRTLLDMRRTNTPSRLATRTLTLNLTSESKRNLEVIGGLNVPTFIELKANYKSIVREQSDHTLTVQVIF